jgi:hypothetical protein
MLTCQFFESSALASAGVRPAGGAVASSLPSTPAAPRRTPRALRRDSDAELNRDAKVQHIKRADELRPDLLQVVSPWQFDATGALVRTSTAIELENNQEKIKMKKSGKAKP